MSSLHLLLVDPSVQIKGATITRKKKSDALGFENIYLFTHPPQVGVAILLVDVY